MKNKLKEEVPNSPNDKAGLIYRELERIRQDHKGLLDPIHVVNAASKKDSILHPYFEWDNTKAAQLYRLRQARDIIRVCVTVDEVSSVATRAFVSLENDRNNGGYRAIVDVLRDEALTQQLLDQALRELKSFSMKYKALEKLAAIEPIFKEINIILQKHIINEIGVEARKIDNASSYIGERDAKQTLVDGDWGDIEVMLNKKRYNVTKIAGIYKVDFQVMRDFIDQQQR